MAIPLEKIKFNGINKDISPASVDNIGNRLIVNPITDALNVRYLSSEHSDSLVAESIKGTTQITVNGGLPAGTNKCIGTYEDKQNNLMFFFIYNSNGSHSIYKYSPVTSTATLVFQSSVLNFQDNPLYLVTGVGSINNLLFFSDGFNPQRVINITRNYTYVGFVEDDINLTKQQPISKPTLFPGTAGEVNGHYHYREQLAGAIVNPIADKNIQFSYRYIYLDDEQSVLAPYSILSRSEAWPDQTNVAKSKIKVRVLVTSTINQLVKKIELLYRENNTGTWKVWNIITPTNGPSFYDRDFTGTEFISEVAESESSKVFESVPNFSKALCIQKNRLFVTDDESGFNDTVAGGVITLSPLLNDIAGPQFLAFKNNAQYKVVVGLWDAAGRSMGVVNPTIVNIADLISPYNFGPDSQNYESMAISYSKTLNIIGTSNKTFTVEKEFARFIKFGPGTMTNKVVSFYDSANSNNFVRGTVLSADVATAQITITSVVSGGAGTKTDWVAIYSANADGTNHSITAAGNFRYNIQATIGITFIPPPKATHFSVMVSDNLTYDDYFQCQVVPYFYRYDHTASEGIPGDSFLMDQARVYFNTSNVPSSQNGWTNLHLQLPMEVPVVIDDSWYVRILDGLQITNGEAPGVKQTLERVQGVVGGDMVSVNQFGANNWQALYDYSKTKKLTVEFLKPKTNTSVITYREVTDRKVVNTNGTLAETGFLLEGDTYTQFVRQSHREPQMSATGAVGSIFSNALIVAIYKSNAALVVESPTPTNKQSLANLVAKKVDFTNALKRYVLDYSKKSASRGITLIEVEDNKRVSTSKTKIRFSNKFIQNTNVNGLNSFDAGNHHSVSSERGQIKKLVPVRNNILAVHERACTSLYVEEGIIKTADNQDSLTVTSNVIGHDTKLQLDYGSYHPESVKEVDGMAFGFDVFKGVAWRYTNEGLHPISNNGMKEYFRQKGVEYLPIKDTCKIIGEIDVFHKEYVLTFRKADGSGETWAYNYVENLWVCRMSFIPEMYGRIGNDLFSFVNGVPWKHNSNSLHNYFYGVQYGRIIKIAANPYPSKNKIGLGIHIAASEALSANPDEQIIKVDTPSGQHSYTMFDEFEILEGTHYGDILMDVNTPNMEVGLLARLDGDNMRGEYFLIEFTTNRSSRAPVRFMNLAYELSEYSQ